MVLLWVEVLMSAADADCGGCCGCCGCGGSGGSLSSEETGNTASQMLSIGLVQLPESKCKDLLQGNCEMGGNF